MVYVVKLKTKITPYITFQLSHFIYIYVHINLVQRNIFFMPKVFQWDCYGDFRKNIIHIEIVVEFSKKKY